MSLPFGSILTYLIVDVTLSGKYCIGRDYIVIAYIYRYIYMEKQVRTHRHQTILHPLLETYWCPPRDITVFSLFQTAEADPFNLHSLRHRFSPSTETVHQQVSQIIEGDVLIVHTRHEEIRHRGYPKITRPAVMS